MENTSNFDLVESNLVGSNESYEFTFFVDIYIVQPCDAMEFMLVIELRFLGHKSVDKMC